MNPNFPTSSVRVRFAPSPTGFLHIGGLRTALFNYLLARKLGGTFILRIEDTDRARYVPGSVEHIIDALRWTGLEYDEGPEKGGEYGPYFQSERLDLYRQYAQQLVDQGKAYACFCPPERLEELRREQTQAKQPPRYDGRCRALTAEEANRRVEGGEAHVVRAKFPTEGRVVVDDLIRGQVEFVYGLLDDQVLVKSDGFPTYHLAVVVDDHLMNISHVLRAEEWLPSTPKHVWLYEAFGWTPPQYAHLPLILSPKGGKLSKRDGAVSTLSYRDDGYVPEALINFIAFLGWNPKTERELFTLPELVEEFDIAKINKSGAVFSLERLNFVNAQYIKQLPIAQLTDRCEPFYAAAGIPTDDRAKLEKATALIQDRLVTLKEAPDLVRFLFDLPAYTPEVLIPKKSTPEAARESLEFSLEILKTTAEDQFTAASLRQLFMDTIKERGLTNGGVLWPFRVSLSGQANSPDVFEIAEALGKEETVHRVQQSIELLRG